MEGERMERIEREMRDKSKMILFNCQRQTTGVGNGKVCACVCFRVNNGILKCYSKVFI